MLMQPAIPALRETEDEASVRESVRGIAQSFGPDYYQRQVAEDGNCADLWKALGDAGYLGAHLPEEYGGGGLGLRTMTTVMEETALAGCPVIGMVFSPGVVGTVLERGATEEQKARWLPDVASGVARISFALTEPDAGSNSQNISTTARREGENYVLNGQKYYISGMESATAVFVVARTSTDEASGRGRLSLFMVDADAPGLTRTRIHTHVRMPEHSWQVFIDDVEVPADRLIAPEGEGLATTFTGLNAERILTAAICLGLGKYALAKASDYARERTIWSAPIGSHQGIAHPLADAYVRLQAAVLMTSQACVMYDEGGTGPAAGELANMAKYLAADAALHALDAAINTHGGNGVADEYQLANYFFLIRMLNMGPVSKEMILNFVAERALRLPRSY